MYIFLFSFFVSIIYRNKIKIQQFKCLKMISNHLYKNKTPKKMIINSIVINVYLTCAPLESILSWK